MPNLAHKNRLNSEMGKKLAAEAVQAMGRGDMKEAEVKLTAIQPGERHKNKYFSGRMKEDVLREAGWKNDKKLIPAPEEHEKAIIDLCSVSDTLTKEIVADVLANGTIAEKLELLKIIQGGKVAAVKEDNGIIRAVIAANAKPKNATAANVQVNVDRRGIAVNGMRTVSSAPSQALDPPKASPTILHLPKPPETASKSPLDQEEEQT
jgi:hypothetical protein